MNENEINDRFNKIKELFNNKENIPEIYKDIFTEEFKNSNIFLTILEIASKGT